MRVELRTYYRRALLSCRWASDEVVLVPERTSPSCDIAWWRSAMWDPGKRGNLRGELLRGWARQLGLQLLNRAGHPTCERPQKASVVHLACGLSAISSRFLGWE
ncbi:hypothetical protein M0802_015097 [Mischocyttarus mexicanus]|nr:hypothetical protein M0802_015097 [Mischocyttarus mexicanus]